MRRADWTLLLEQIDRAERAVLNAGVDPFAALVPPLPVAAGELIESGWGNSVVDAVGGLIAMSKIQHTVTAIAITPDTPVSATEISMGFYEVPPTPYRKSVIAFASALITLETAAYGNMTVKVGSDTGRRTRIYANLTPITYLSLASSSIAPGDPCRVEVFFNANTTGTAGTAGSSDYNTLHVIAIGADDVSAFEDEGEPGIE